MSKGVFAGLLVLIAAVLVFFAGVNYERNAHICPVKEKVVVEYHHDTITLQKPPKIVIREVVRTDTLFLTDSIFVDVPIEQAVYADSNYRAVVSGWHPSLDTISVYPVTKIITKVQEVQVAAPPKRLGVGFVAGYGVGKDGLTPYIGFGASYNLVIPKKKIVKSWKKQGKI